MLQSQLKNLVSSTYKELDAPKKVCLNLTSHCNLKCKFCFGPQNFTKELDTKQVKGIIKNLAHAGVERLVLSGGEPLSRKDLPEIIEFASGHDLKVSLATNGLLLNRHFISKVGKYLELIEISLDGSNEEIETLMRRKGLFSRIVKCLELMQRQDIEIKINTMVSKKNYSDMENIGNTVKKFNVRCWKIFQFIPRNRGKKYKKEFEISDNEFKRLKQKITEKFPDLNIIWASKKYFSKSYFNIYPDGLVSVPQINNEKTIGNILKHPLKELWANKIFYKNKHLYQTSIPYDS